MTKKILLTLLLFAIVIAGVIWYKFFVPKTGFANAQKYLYIHTKESTKQAVLQAISEDSIVTTLSDFEFAANRLQYWDKIKPGRYLINKEDNIITIVRKLRNGDVWPVKLVLNKIRFPEDFAKLVGRNFETDSIQVMHYLQQSDTSNIYSIIPNTYAMPWTYAPEKIVKKLNAEYNKWWNQNERKQKATQLGYTPQDIYNIASIVEEETNRIEDKKNVASVYLNRLQKKMPLQADPTIRYALKNFKMNRVLFVHLKTPSPYNTYLNAGLPPGPICTPSATTIDAVLNSPKTNYLYFVADADLKGGSTFTTNYADHMKAASIYQDSLSAWLKRKAARQKSDSLAKQAAP